MLPWRSLWLRDPPRACGDCIHQTILLSTCTRPANVPKPQSTPAMTFPRPTTLAKFTIRRRPFRMLSRLTVSRSPRNAFPLALHVAPIFHSSRAARAAGKKRVAAPETIS